MKKFLMVVCTLVIILIGTLLLYKKYDTKDNNLTSNQVSKTNNEIIKGNKPLYSKAGKIDEDEAEKIDGMVIKTYEEYKKILDENEMQYDLKVTDFTKYDFIVMINDSSICDDQIVGIEDAKVEDGIAKILVNYNEDCRHCSSVFELYFVGFSKNKLNDNINREVKYQKLNNEVCD